MTADPFNTPVVTYGKAERIADDGPRPPGFLLDGLPSTGLTLPDLAELGAWVTAAGHLGVAMMAEAASCGFPDGVVKVFPHAEGTSLAVNAVRETTFSALAFAFLPDGDAEIEEAEVGLAEVIDLDSRRGVAADEAAGEDV